MDASQIASTQQSNSWLIRAIRAHAGEVAQTNKSTAHLTGIDMTLYASALLMWR